MAFVDIPFNVWRRATKSQLLIQLQMCLLLILLPALEGVFGQANAPIIARPGCNDTCGNVKIPFPFRIGPNCSLDHWFEIECRSSPKSKGSMVKPFLSKFNTVEVMEIYLDDENSYNGASLVVGIPPLNACASGTHSHLKSSINLTGSPYTFSTGDNVFIMEGCPGSALLLDSSVLDRINAVIGGCGTICRTNNVAIPKKSCYGVQCCQTPLSTAEFSILSFYQIEFNREASSESQNCLVATLIKSDSVNQYAGKLSSSDPIPVAPVLLYWSWISNHQADNDSDAYCTRNLYDNTLSCSCIDNHYGNAYVSNGCQELLVEEASASRSVG